MPNSTAVAVLVALGLLLHGTVSAHVDEGTGEELQLYSYFTSTAPTIDADLITSNDEWKDAYVRNIPIVSRDNSDSTTLTLLLMNDSDYVYIGAAANLNTMGNQITMQLFFDQGAAGGSHNDRLDGGGTGVNNGEYRCHITTDNNWHSEYSFDGTSWVQQNNGSEVFMGRGENVGVALGQIELKIPIRNNPAPGDDRSFLDVGPDDELGFYLALFSPNAGDTYLYWHTTSGADTQTVDAPQWMDLKLGVEKSYTTFYATYYGNGTPTIDGAIAGTDDAWRGCYTRNIVLTNFRGSTVDAILYAVDDPDAKDLYVGLRIDDDDQDAGDYCQVYQEINTADPATGRNYLLDNNKENAVRGDGAYGSGDDRYWNGSSWASDGGLAADYANTEADMQWHTDHYEYEFLVNRSGGSEDVDIQNDADMGFLIRYYDDGDGTDYYWDYSPNSDVIQIDANALLYYAIGWPAMQLGAPYLQVVFPEDNSPVEGVVNTRIYVRNTGNTTADSTYIYRKASGAATRSALTRIADSYEWSGAWDVSALSDGPDTLVVEAWDNGMKTERLVNVTINNGASGSTLPTVDNFSPAPGSSIAGTQTISFDVAPGTGSISLVEVSVDGEDFTSNATATTYDFNTLGKADGSHTIQIRATNSSGGQSTSQVVNYVIDNTPEVSLDSLEGGQTLSGRTPLWYTATAKGGAAITADTLLVDGSAYDTLDRTGHDSLNTTDLANGTLSLQIKTIDANGNSGLSGTLTIVVDNSPGIVLTAPGGGDTLWGKAALSYTHTAVAPNTVVSDSLYLDGTGYAQLASDGTDTLNTTVLDDGEHTLQLKVTDSKGNTAWSSEVIVLVRNAPTVRIDTLLADTVVGGWLVVGFTAQTPSADDSIVTTEIALDGGVWEKTTSGSSDSLDTRERGDGAHLVQIKATDANGRVGYSQTVKITVHNVPTVTLTAPPVADTVHGTDTIRYTVDYASHTTRDTTEISIDGGAWEPTTAPLYHVWTTADVMDGSHTVQVRAVSSSNDTGYSRTRQLLVHNSPVVSLRAPSAGATVRGVETLRFTVRPAQPATVVKREISIDGGAWIDAFDSTWFTVLPGTVLGGAEDTILVSVSTVSWADGSHTLAVRAHDDSGRIGYAAQRTVITHNAPLVSIVEPSAGDILTDTVQVRFSVETVDTARVESTWISVDGAGFVATRTDSTADIATRELSDGTHTVKVKVRDTMGKTAISERRLFSADNTAPVMAAPSVEYPTEVSAARRGASLRITVAVHDMLCGIAADSGVVLSVSAVDATPLTVLMTDSGADDRVPGDNVYTAPLAINTDSTGTIAYTVRGVDRLGNADTLTGTIVLDNIEPTTEFTLHSTDDSAQISLTDTMHYGSLILRGTYGDKGGSELARAFVSVLNSDNEHVGNSPLVLSPEDSLCSRVLQLAPGINTVTLFAQDRAGNTDRTAVSFANLDLVKPTTVFTIEPEPEAGVDGVTRTYFEKLVLKGAYADSGGAGLERVFIAVHNDSAHHVNDSPIELAPRDSICSRILNLVPGLNIITMTAIDASGNRDSVVQRIRYTEPKATEVVGRDGGVVLSPDSSSVRIPEHALLGQREITITRVSAQEQPKPLSDSMTLLNVAHEFGPDGTVFRKPVTLTLGYTDADLDKDQDGTADIDTSRLTIVYWNGSTWLPAGEVTRRRGRISVAVNHFTMYDLAEDNSPAPGKLDVYWTHNPVRRGERGSGCSELAFELPGPGVVSVSILDMAGDVVYRLVERDTPYGAGIHPVMWCGDNVAGRFAGAGLYVYLFRYKDTASGKVEVIRKPVGLLK